MFIKITPSLSLFFRLAPTLLCLLVTFGTIAVGATAHAITQGGTITTGNNLGKDKAATDHMSMTEMVKQVTQQSAAKHRIETLADGRARIPAPLQTIDAFAASEGITVVSTNKDKPGNFAIRATSLGRTNVQGTLILPGQVSVETDLVRIVHPEISEELTTSAEGVRQDFVISTAPQGSGELALELVFSGAALRSSGNIINLTMSGGRELVYHRLNVTDSSGKVLPSRFELLDSNSLRIVVADAGAAYPVRIDPTITDSNWVSIARPDTNGSIFALASDGTNLYAGGNFTAIGGVVANKIAKWNGSVWSAMGSGIGSYSSANVAALTWDGTNLYAGGFFDTAGGVTAHNIAKWDGSAWSALGDGIDASNNIHALAWDGANLYAGGYIAITPADVFGVKVAKWDGSTWSNLGSFSGGSFTRINAFAVNGGSLYVGGSFGQVGSVVANNIAKWDGSAWSGIGGTNSDVHALLWNGSNLYAGGEFNTAGGVNVNRVAKWNGSVWSALGSGLFSEASTVTTLAWYGSGLYAGGDFTTAGGVSANYLAKWDGYAWVGMSGMTVGVGHLLTVGSNLYVEGDFTAVGGVSASKIAQWNGTWSALGSGIDKNINALLWDGTNLYAGGLFSTAEGTIANNVAKWNGSTWSALGSGLDGQVYALASDGTNLYAGGNFVTAGGVSVNYIAKWNGSAWSALGSGMNSRVYTLAWGGTNLYAGGDFTNAGGIGVTCIAKWNGSEWSSLRGGLAGSVYALAWDGVNLYAGGEFSGGWNSGWVNANCIAKWNGSDWSALGGGVGYVRALAWDGTNLYAAGNGSRVFKWNGSAWSTLSNYVYNVYALAWDGSNLYAGGSFTTIGGVSTNRIAKWNGSAWSALGSGMSGAVNALALDGSNLYAAGDFIAAGGNAARVAYFNKNIPTVNFVSRGGSVIDSQSLALNTTTSVPTAPTKSGTDFVGWYANDGLNLPFNFDTPITSDTWIYAKWSFEPPSAITGSVSNITTTTSTLDGTVTPNASTTTVTFQYGTTSGYGSSATATQSPLAPSATGSAVSAAITGLTCGSTYHYQVVATNSDGNAYGYDGTFTTSECPDITPPVTTASLLGGTYTTAKSVTLTANETATIYYTLNGATPTTASLVYNSPLSITASSTLKYFARDPAGNSETTKTQIYTITLPTVNMTPPPILGSSFNVIDGLTGGVVTFDWSNYDPGVSTVTSYQLYYSERPFMSVSGMIPAQTYAPPTTTGYLRGLADNVPIYVALVPIGDNGLLDVSVAAFVITPTRQGVSGLVKELLTNVPLNNIKITAGSYTTYSGSDGTFKLTGLPVGSNILIVGEKDGDLRFTGTTKVVTVAAGQITSTSIVLDPKAQNLAPATPSNCTATAGDGKVTLTWAPNTDADLAGYYVYRDGVALNTNPLKELFYIDQTVSNSTSYLYTVKAVSTTNIYSPETLPLVVLPTASTKPPVDLTASLNCDRTVTLSWIAPSSSDLDGYNVYQQTSSTMSYEGYEYLLGSNVTTWTSDTLDAGQTYTFAVRSVGTTGEELNTTVKTTLSVPSVWNLPQTIVSTPTAGKLVDGNDLYLQAEPASQGCGTVTTSNVRFQYRPTNTIDWFDVPAALAQYPNPAVSSPYFTKWDVTGLTEGNYDLRAVASNSTSTDYNAGFITVTIDHLQPQIAEYRSADNTPSAQGQVEKYSANAVTTGLGSANFPAGSLTSDAILTIASLPLEAQPTGSSSLVASPVDMTLSSGQTLFPAGKEVELGFSYSDTNNDGIIDGQGTFAQDAEAATFNTTTGLWEPLKGTTLDTTKKQVKGMTSHFSTFGLSRKAGLPIANKSVGIYAPASNFSGYYQIRWNFAGGTGNSYELQQASNSGFTQNVTTIYTGTTNYTNLSNQANGSYYYRVRTARPGHQPSEWKTIASGVTVDLTCGNIAGIYAPVSNTTGYYRIIWNFTNTPGATYVLTENDSEIYRGNKNYFDVTAKRAGSYNYKVKATKNGYKESALKGPVTSTVALTVVNIAGIYAPTSSTSGYYQVSWNVSNTAGVTYKLYENGNTMTPIYEGPNNYYDVTGKGNGTYSYTVQAFATDHAPSIIKGTATTTVTPTVGNIAGIYAPTSSTSDYYQVSWNASNTAGVTYKLYENGNTMTPIYEGPNNYYDITGKGNGTFSYTVQAFATDHAPSAIKGTATTTVLLTCGNIAGIYAPASNTSGYYQVSWNFISNTGGVTYILQESNNGGSSWTDAYTGISNYYDVSNKESGSYLYKVRATKTSPVVYLDSAVKGLITVNVTR